MRGSDRPKRSSDRRASLHQRSRSCNPYIGGGFHGRAATAVNMRRSHGQIRWEKKRPKGPPRGPHKGAPTTLRAFHFHSQYEWFPPNFETAKCGTVDPTESFGTNPHWPSR